MTNEFIQPEPQSVPIATLLADVERGHIKIPQFQRDFVWSREKSAKLIDSILKGYPIGTFILWKTKEALRTVKNIGGARLPDTPEGEYTQHVLDGQQRLTSLYASVRGLTVARSESHDDFADMWVNLTATGEDDIVVLDTGTLDTSFRIRVADLYNADLGLMSKYPREVWPRLSECQRRLQTYAFSVVLVKEASLDVATEIFTRINVTGKPLSVFEIMVAKTFDAGRSFDLAIEYEKLVAELREVDYDTISPSVILQTVAMIIAGECTRKDILGIAKQTFINTWPIAVDAIRCAVDYFRNHFRIGVANLLPFGSLIVPFSYFFSKHPDRPSGTTQQRLDDFFWRCSLGGRYSYAVESHLAADIRHIDTILAGSLPDYDFAINTSAAFVRANGAFSTGRSYIKALLCVFAYQEPKSFADNSIVRISNDWLKQANSKNYHHFFPKGYLKRRGYDSRLANHIGNITIVDDFLNKRQIRDQAPSAYMSHFAERNSALPSTMRTHLIDIANDGIEADDYDTFLSHRCEAISTELRKRLIPRDIDDKAPEVRPDEHDDADM